MGSGGSTALISPGRRLQQRLQRQLRDLALGAEGTRKMQCLHLIRKTPLRMQRGSRV
ncbi:protein of unknown function [Stenotrophomonas maltophilia]|nr:protein of unknown function [Stenotrophomonas maltophilia]